MRTAPFQRGRIIWVAFLMFLAWCPVLILAAEGTLRWKGVRPWRVFPLGIEVRPGGHFFTSDSLLGYTHLPGQFQVTLHGRYRFTVRHLPNTLRATHPPESPRENQKPELWIMGCSFTYGWSVNDEQSYPWLLQAEFPQYEVVNYGVNGYGTIHSLLQLRRDLAAGRIPRIVIIGYAGFHDQRNTFTRLRRKEVAPWTKLGSLRQPVARLGKDGNLGISYSDVNYHEFPFMRLSALSHYLEEKYNAYEDRRAQSHRVSEAIIREIANLSRIHHFALIVAGLDRFSWQNQAMLNFARVQGIRALDVSVDLSAPENTNRPYDPHPSALAHRHFADRLAGFLRAEGLE